MRTLKKHRKSGATVSKQEIDVLCTIGGAVLLCHNIEFLLARCFLFVLMENANGVKDSDMPRLFAERDKKTLGHLITRLRKGFCIAKSFNRNLERLVRYRNLLIHGIAVRRGYELHTKRGLNRLHRLASRVVREAVKVEVVLIGCYSANLDFIDWANSKQGRSPRFQRLREPTLERYFFKLFEPRIGHGMVSASPA